MNGKDLSIYNALRHIRNLAQSVLVAEGAGWQIEREQALIEIRDELAGVLEEVDNRTEGAKRPDYGLRFGSKEYFKAWDEFIQPLSDFLGIEPHGIDPTVSYFHENEYVQLPAWFVELFNEKLAEKIT